MRSIFGLLRNLEIFVLYVVFWCRFWKNSLKIISKTFTDFVVSLIWLHFKMAENISEIVSIIWYYDSVHDLPLVSLVQMRVNGYTTKRILDRDYPFIWCLMRSKNSMSLLHRIRRLPQRVSQSRHYAKNFNAITKLFSGILGNHDHEGLFETWYHEIRQKHFSNHESRN